MTQKQAQVEAVRRWGNQAFALCVAVKADRDRAMQHRFGVSARTWAVGAVVDGRSVPFGAGDSWKAAFRSADVYRPGNETKFNDLREAYGALNRDGVLLGQEGK